ncbi:uncharacterized protein N7479_003570 [Penicillium vulpinum]|uniref:NmrA-like domain-containing protein n=1 Tax=Penicillium vulpinum TaxID=29845 RepID=A0A1V6RWF7_9EURO|nr:uncharacterized protein N7479_003570 [Penicillium vulpinum]KAJ5963694.1 hypothetical protein N7479_003570 [Penicillium vulpinum]OQE06121.1 hypothetical protein PENVUL_c020G07275 [Penicillium vulpinum]
MEPIRNVALLGKGWLGSAILEQLVNSGFQVTVLSRTARSADEPPASIKTLQVDYSSIDSLVSALQGQDAVVSTVGSSGISAQKTVIDASIQAGVRRFIPSDFGALTTRPGGESLPLNALWIEIQKYLKEKALSGQIEYTLFAVGPFLEFVMSMPFLTDLQTQTAPLYDNGMHTFSSTSVSSVGKAVAGALKNAPATKNRLVSVHDIVLTQNKVLDLAKKYSGPDVKWIEDPVNAAVELETILENTKQGDLDLFKTLALLKAALLGGKFEAEFKIVDNDLVGVPLLSDDEFERIFAAAFKPSQIIAQENLEANIEGIQGEA